MFRMTRVILAGLLFAPLTNLAAQSNGANSYGILTGLQGKKVRLSVSVVDGDESRGSVDISGSVFEVRGDSIHVLYDGGQLTHIPLSNVRSIEVRRGRDHVRGAGIGALVGVGFGAVMSLVPVECDHGYGVDCRSDGSRPTSAQYLGANLRDGLFLGILLGSAIGTTRWENVLTRPKVSVAPARGGGIRLGVSF